MDANRGYPSCEIEVRGHRLRVYLDQAIIALGRVRRVRDGSELRVFQSCHNKWGKQFRVRAGGKYLSLSRLNHWLPGREAHPEVVQGATDFHHQIADALLPQ